MYESSTNQSLFDNDVVSLNMIESNLTNSRINNNNNDTTIDPSTSTTTDPSLIITGFMMGLVAFFSFLLCYMLLPLFLQWVRRKIPVTSAQVNRRYETIEGWLITKRVKAHCIVCEEMQRIFGSSSSRSIHIKLTTSQDTAETILDEQEPHQCSICMESFELNDLVSWSPSTECDHVFHHACIKTWLLHHECCPYCRVCLLSVDKRNIAVAQIPARSRGVSLGVRGGNTNKKRKNWGNDQLKELAVQRHQRILSTYFCLKEGLVTLEQPMNICLCDVKSTVDMESNPTSDTKTIRTTELSKSTLRHFFVSDVPPNEMMALRTHPKSIRSTSDVVVTITTPTVGTEASMDGGDTMLAHDAVDYRAANAIMDIETTMKELPVISDNVADRNDTV